MISKKTLNVFENASFSAAESLACEDLLTEILLRLSSRELSRFRSVCKQWHSLITSPIFRDLHTPDRKPFAGLYLSSTNLWGAYCLSLPAAESPIPNIPPVSIKILQSCNGLLLCTTTSRPSKKCSRYLIYNPTTENLFRLPEFDIQHCIPSTVHGMSLAFDPNKSPHYKVICVVREKQQELFYVQIYSSDTHNWKFVSEPLTRPVNHGAGVYWNGAIHWLFANLYFNIEEETFNVMHPPSIPSWRTHYYFGESGDYLHYVKIFKRRVGFEISVYQMRRDYHGWLLIESVPIDMEFKHPHCNTYSVLSVVRGEDEEPSFLVFEISGHVMLYDFRARTRQDLCEFKGRRDDCSIHSFQYIETQCCAL